MPTATATNQERDNDDTWALTSSSSPPSSLHPTLHAQMPRLFELKMASKGETTFARALVPRKRQASLTNQGFKLFASRKSNFGKTTDRHFDANEADISIKVVTVRRFSRSESIAHVTIQPLDGREPLILATTNVEDAREFVNELAAIKKLPTTPETSTPESTPPASSEVTPASTVDWRPCRPSLLRRWG